jgi:DNA topoisomerase-1
LCKSGDEVILPSINVDTILDLDVLEKEQNFTKPPARYTEASLVKKLEAEGVGRPSTYASTISTIQTRGYVQVVEKNLAPTATGELVNKYLVENFPDIVSINFTAKIEDKLDHIATGELDWHEVLKEFCLDLRDKIKEKKGVVKEYTESRILRTIGIHPETQQAINIMVNTYGATLVMGSKEKGETVKYGKIPEGVEESTIDLNKAISILSLPKLVGIIDGKEAKVNIGKFGPYIQLDGKYHSVPKDIDILSLTVDKAKEIIAEDIRKKLERANNPQPQGEKKFFKKKWVKK